MSSLTNTPSLIPVVGARPGVMVEVIPGKKYLPLSEDSVPPVAVAESVPAGDGTWRWMAKICPQWVSITKRNLARLGIGISVQGMRRLCTAGFVQARQVTPGLYQFSYHGYLAHEEATADPEFWERTEPGQTLSNRKRYSAAIG